MSSKDVKTALKRATAPKAQSVPRESKDKRCPESGSDRTVQRVRVAELVVLDDVVDRDARVVVVDVHNLRVASRIPTVRVQLFHDKSA